MINDNYSSLSEELPYWEFDQDVCILNDGSLSKGFELTPIDMECFDNDRINQLTFGLRSLVNTISENLTLQIHVSTTSDFTETLVKHNSLLSLDNQFMRKLDEQRSDLIAEEIKNNHLIRPRIFAFLHSPSSQQKSAFSLKAVKKFSNDFSHDYEVRRQELDESVESLMSGFSALGFESRNLNHKDIISLLYKYLNPSRSEVLDQPNVFSPADDGENSPREQLVFGDLILDKSEFILDQKYNRVLSLKTLPEVTLAGMMDGFLRFPFHYDLIFTFKIPEQSAEMSKLQQKRRMAHSLSQTKNGQVSDIESESRLSDTEGLIREIIDTGQRIFNAEMLIVLKDESTPSGLKSLNQKTREVLARFKSLSGAEGISETVGGWKIFKSNLPMAPLNLERVKKMKTNNLIDFLPIYGSRTGDERPMCLVHSRQNSLVSIDPYSAGLSNYNSLVTGSSGSGKSFFNNILLLQQIARSVKVFIIDIGGSYKKLTELAKGEYFEIKLSDEYAINPFAISNVESGPSSEKIKALTSIIEQMVSDDNVKLSKYERVLIERTIKEVYDCAKITKEVPILSDFEDLCKNALEPELQKIGKLLFTWVGDSPYGKLLDRRQALSSNSPVISFDLKGLSQHPDLQSVMILILTQFILDQVESDRKNSKRVILDEAWELLQSPAAAQFMEYAARTFRKTGSGITFITQGVEEIVKSPIGSAILNNTSMKVVMSQRGDLKPLETVLKLNPREMSLIQGLEQRKGIFSEGFLIEGEHRQVIRIYPMPLEYWISTSDAKDNQYLLELQESGLTLEQAIAKASDEFPFGILQKRNAA